MINIKKFFKIFVDICVVIFCKLLPKVQSYEQVVIKVDAIGDMIISLNLLSKFHSKAPNSTLFIINEAWADLFESLSGISNYIKINPKKFHSNLSYRISIIKKISVIKCFKLYNPNYSREWLTDLCSLSVVANHKVAFQGDHSTISKSLKKMSNFFYHQIIQSESKFEMDLQAIFLRHTILPSYISTKFKLKEKPKSYFSKDKEYFCIFPGSSWSGKIWPKENFIEVIKVIQEKKDIQLVILGGPQELLMRDFFESNLDPQKSIFLIQKLNLNELTQVIANAKFLISNDTAAAHIGELCETPTLMLLGGGHFGRFAPYHYEDQSRPSIIPLFNKMPCYHCNWQCNQNYIDGEAVLCIKNISPQEVLHSLEGLL